MEETKILLAEKLLFPFDSKKYVDWAISIIEKGFESESLFILAGLDNDSRETREKYFDKTISELNFSINIEKNLLFDTYSNFIATQVINKKISPFEGIRILEEIVRASDYEAKYMRFLDLDEDLHYMKIDGSTVFNPGLTKENKEQFIVEEFKSFLQENLNHS